MSLAAITLVTPAAEDHRPPTAEPLAEAKRLVADAERAGRARLEEARAQAEAQVRDLLKEAEERAAKHTEQVLEQTRSSCGALRAEAQKKLDQAAQSIVRRVVNS